MSQAASLAALGRRASCLLNIETEIKGQSLQRIEEGRENRFGWVSRTYVLFTISSISRFRDEAIGMHRTTTRQEYEPPGQNDRSRDKSQKRQATEEIQIRGAELDRLSQQLEQPVLVIYARK